MKLSGLEDLFAEQLKDLYSAENQLLKALPKMAKKATTSSLSDVFQSHLEQTKTHVERLEKISKTLDIKLTGHKCIAMEGLIKEGAEAMEKTGDDRVIDAGIIAAAQRVEHYEISAYGTARTLAEQLGHVSVAKTLQTTENEESAADEKLTMLAIDEVYPSLLMQNDDEAMDESENNTRASKKKKKSRLMSAR